MAVTLTIGIYKWYTNDAEAVTQYKLYTDGSAIWRKGVRDNAFVWDVTLTGTGFSGAEDTDWTNVFNIS